MRYTLRFTSIILFSFLFLFSCKDQKTKPVGPVDIGFSQFVNSYTGGVISRKSTILVELAQDPRDSVEAGDIIHAKLVTLAPHVSGKLQWVGNRTLTFTPDSELKQGASYKVTVNLGKIIDVPDKYKTMSFEVKTLEQSFSVNELSLNSYDYEQRNLQYLSGKVYTADYADSKNVEAIVKVKLGDREMPLVWWHSTSGTSHVFTVDSLKRADGEKRLTISWDGKPLSVSQKGKEEVVLPAMDEFKVVSVQVMHQAEPHVLIRFSDPLSNEQDLKGLINIDNSSNLRYLIELNELKVYTSSKLIGEHELVIHDGIRNAFNNRLQSPVTMKVFFEDIRPAVRLIGKGNIMPASREMIFPFEAVNLKAVDLRVIKIFSDNIHQFFQNNSYSGQAELKQVARLLVQKKIDLQAKPPSGLKNWNTYTVDLAKLMDVEQGAIYCVEIRFNREYSLWRQEKPEPSDTISMIDRVEKEQMESDLATWWDEPGWYSTYYYPRYYEWSERDNPDHVSYYNSDRFKSRNLFATNIGVIAKGGDDMSMNFAVTNLKTTAPITGAELKIYNYQKQLVEKVNTDINGLARVKLKNKPFLLVAEKDGQKAYLRLDDGSSLSLSNFDISGNVVQKGIKGYIYGERGVWRPGDRVYLTFILEDKQDNLPDTHPVIFEFLNPKNQVVSRQVKATDQNGFYCFTTETDDNALTGNWSARIKVGGFTFSKQVKVETVKPNRLKIDLKFGASDNMLLQGSTKGQLTAAWLHGGTAKNLKARVSANFSTTKTTFKGYLNFVFDDPAKVLQDLEEKEIFDNKVNERGVAEFGFEMPSIPTAPGVLNAHFTTRVFEETGDFSIDVKTIHYAPYSSLVGAKLPAADSGWYTTDESYDLDVVTVDPLGNPIDRKDLEVTVYRINWRWWWDAGEDNLARYVNDREREPVFSRKVNTIKGKATIPINIAYNDWRDNARYLIHVKDKESGHSTGITAYFSRWGQWAAEGDQSAATMLAINADKEKYNVGEQVTVTIPSSKNGRALVSLETGNTVVDMFWVETKEQNTRFIFDVKPEMAPNIFVHISLVQPHEQTENDAPIRLYGVIPVLVEDPASHLEPLLVLPEELAPEKEYEVKISEKTGREMTYTLAVVDEGLLDLTRFKTPDPWPVFYAREALGVKTWDYYDYILGAYGARLEKAFAVGGDEALMNGSRQKITRFKPVVDFIGPIRLDKNKTNTHKLKMHDYVGSVRVMVVAGNEGSYGKTEQAVKVIQPLMLLATLPRVLGPGEEVKLPVNVFAMKPDVKDVTVTVSFNEMFRAGKDVSQAVHFDETGDQLVGFDLKVAEKTGIGKVKITAKSGNHQASQDIEIEVRPSNPRVVNIREEIIEPGQKLNAAVKAPGMEGTNIAKLELSGIPPLNLGSRLNHLIQYPHGCLEQITSAGFPQLMLGNLIELSEIKKKEIEKNVKATLNKIPRYQVSSGGLAYWPGNRYASVWATNYAGHFMLKAEEAGYSLPYGLKEKWLAYQKEAARTWKSALGSDDNSSLTQAYRLYTLALAQNPDFGAMNRLREETDLDRLARWRLAAAYAISGQPEAAGSMIDRLSKEVKPYRELSGSYGSDIRDKAMIVETLVALKRITEAYPLVADLSARLSSGEWMSTQTAAYSLLAIAGFAGDGFSGRDQLKAGVSVNKSEMKEITSAKPVWQSDVQLENNMSAVFQVENRTGQIMYARIISEGIPITGDTTSVQSNLFMDVRYTDMAGKTINPGSVSQGTDFVAEVSLHNPGQRGTYKEMALTVIFPSGWEIINNRINDVESPVKSDNFDYQDIRDDRVLTYFELEPNARKTFRVMLNAAYEGKFYLPSVQCEAMYDNTINARRPGRWVRVIKD